MKRLERLVAIALYLGARRRVLAREVAAHFDVTLRTVYRDMHALQLAGFPLEGNAGDGYRLRQESYLRPLAFTPDEAEALTVAAHTLAASTRATLRDALTRATSKLEASLDKATLRRVLDLRRRVLTPDFTRASGPTTEILDAIRERRVVGIHYTEARSKKRTKRDVEPLGLVCMGDAWWLVAYCRLRDDGRAFRLDLITTWTPRPEQFTPRDGFSLTELAKRDHDLAPALFGS